MTEKTQVSWCGLTKAVGECLSQECTLSDWKERTEVLLDLGMPVWTFGAWSH